MCGIAGYNGKKQASIEIKDILTRLEYRGYDSAGIAVVNGKLNVYKDVGTINKVNIPFKDIQGNIGIGHTRWATHGGVTVANAHPHTDCTATIAVVHNGIIENFQELKASLSGHNFISETDTEVIAHLIEENIDKGFDYAFTVAVSQLKGSFAIVACHQSSDVLMVARRGSPILIGIGSNGNYVTSDVQALNGDTKRLIECEDNKTYLVKPNGVLKTAPLLSDWCYEEDCGMLFTQENQVNDKCGYPHFMLKEIYEQPMALKRALSQDDSKIMGVAMDILRASNVVITACGTSRYASIVGRYLMSRLAKKLTEVVVGSELHYFADSFDDRTLIIAVSQSGETADVLKGVRLAKEAGSKVISIINKPYSLLEKLSNEVLYMNCGAEVAVASTKSFTNELAIFYLIGFAMCNQLRGGKQFLSEMPTKIIECFDHITVNKVALEISKSQHIYFIGKGINFAVSGECALKLKEVSYIHAESMGAGELKHGTLSLIEQGTPVVAICPNDYTYEETISNLHEAKARGGVIVGISDKNNPVFDHWLKVPVVPEIYYPIVCAVVGQLLAYFTAINRGLDPDKPRNLAKSVTVV